MCRVGGSRTPREIVEGNMYGVRLRTAMQTTDARTARDCGVQKIGIMLESLGNKNCGVGGSNMDCRALTF
jgi:hypothetical protein